MSRNTNNSETDFDAVVKHSKKKKIRNTVVCLLLLAAIIGAGIYFCFAKLFFVKNLVISEENTEFVGAFPYSEDEMLSGLGIEMDMGLYSFDVAEAQKNAKYSLSYIKDIKISRRLPSTVVAKTTLEVPSFYVSVADDLFIVSDSLKVLEKTDSPEKIELYSLMFLECDDIHSCIVGEKLGIPEDTEQLIIELCDNMTEYGVKNEVSSINVSDKFSIFLNYGAKYIVKIGDSKSLGTKLEFMKRIIEDRTGDVVGGTIDVSDEKNREAIYKKFS